MRDPHVEHIAEALDEAYAQAQKLFPDWIDELYIHKVEIDGQYITVTVGIGNGEDFQTIIAKTT